MWGKWRFRVPDNRHLPHTRRGYPAAVAGVVVVRGVWKRYSRRGPWVLRDVDLRVEPGSVHVVAGGNGSGKSTLLRVVAGAAVPSRGTVRRPASVAYVPERLPADLRLTARRYLAHMARLRGLPGDAAAPLLERLAISPGPDVPVATLSRGNARKVALCQAFLAPAALTVLDEPFGGLDGPAAAELTGLIAEARAGGRAVLVSAHTAGEVPGADHEHAIAAGGLGHELPDGARTRLVLRTPDGDRRVVETADPDAALRAALADGWSFVEGGPVPEAPA